MPQNLCILLIISIIHNSKFKISNSKNAPWFNYKAMGIAVLLGVAIAWIPLVGHLHFESAFLAGLLGSFVAIGYGRKSILSGQKDIQRLLWVLFLVYLAAVPLLIKDLWAGCFSIDGLGFWVFVPSVSIFLAYALVRLFRRLNTKMPGVWAILVVLAIAIGEFLIEFYSFPQVFFYNHIWGYWPGPIYDEVLPLEITLVYFRGITLLWGMLFWFFTDYGTSASARYLTWLAAAGLILGYFNLTEMGLVRPNAAIQQELGGHQSSGHFEIYYDSSLVEQQQAEYYKLRHEFYFRDIANTLEVEASQFAPGIESYIYAHPWQKKRLVGAKFTSYVPVWLKQDQLHIAYPQLSASLKHEMVHVLAKPFGNRLLNASWNIGMVEGLAVAVAGNESSYSTVDQLVAAEQPYPPAEQIKNSLSFTGFYGGRQTVNYVTMGSFIRHLLRNFEIDHLKKFYRTADIQASYPEPIDSLVAGWHRHLETVPVDSIDRARRSALFSIPSLFEKRCPHTQTKSEQAWDRYRFRLAEGDTAKARDVIMSACNPRCPDLRLWSEWAYHQLQQGNARRVLTSSARVDTLLKANRYFPAVLRIADANFSENALEYTLHKRAKTLRKDSSTWALTTDIIYRKMSPSPQRFDTIPGPLKSIVLNRVINRGTWQVLDRYAAGVDSSDITLLNFNTFARVARRLMYLREDSVANQLISQLKYASQRERHHQMVEELTEWKHFLISSGHGNEPRTIQSGKD